MTLKYVKSNKSGMEQVDFSVRTWQKFDFETQILQNKRSNFFELVCWEMMNFVRSLVSHHTKYDPEPYQYFLLAEPNHTKAKEIWLISKLLRANAIECNCCWNRFHYKFSHQKKSSSTHHYVLVWRRWINSIRSASIYILSATKQIAAHPIHWYIDTAIHTINLRQCIFYSLLS